MKPYSHRLDEPRGSGCESSLIDLNVSVSFTATGHDASTIILAVMIPLCFLIRHIGLTRNCMVFQRRSPTRSKPGRVRTAVSGSHCAVTKEIMTCRVGMRLNGLVDD